MLRAMSSESTATSPAKPAILRYVEAVTSGDDDALRACFHPQATWSVPGDLPSSGTWTGPTAIVDEFLAGARGRLVPESVQIELVAMTAEGDTVVLEWSTRARTVTGKDYANSYIASFTATDGLITTVREYFDTQRAAVLYE